jgi:hypothetical protein
MVLIAKVDGAVGSAERVFLKAMATKFRLSDSEMKGLVADTTGVRCSEFDGDSQEAAALVNSLCRCARADGEISASEQRLIDRIGKALKVSGETIRQMSSPFPHAPSDNPMAELVSAVSEVQADQAESSRGIVLFDMDAAWSLCCEASHKEQKSASWGSSLRPQTLQLVCEQFSIDNDERIVLVHDGRALGVRIALVALTDKHLYLTLPFDVNEWNCVMLEDLSTVKSGLVSAKVIQKDGREVTTHGSAAPFLHLVERIIKTCLRCV